MKIVKYRVELDERKKNILVQENVTDYTVDSLTHPKEISDMLNACFHLKRLAEEHVYIIALTVKCEPLGVFELAHGTVSQSVMNPREIFVRLLLVGASAFIIAHNHPSGDCTPSKNDIEATKRVREAADLMGVEFFDHIIIGKEWKSFNESDLFL